MNWACEHIFKMNIRETLTNSLYGSRYSTSFDKSPCFSCRLMEHDFIYPNMGLIIWTWKREDFNLEKQRNNKDANNAYSYTYFHFSLTISFIFFTINHCTGLLNQCGE
jgi:hypothetical protein